MCFRYRNVEIMKNHDCCYYQCPKRVSSTSASMAATRTGFAGGTLTAGTKLAHASSVMAADAPCRNSENCCAPRAGTKSRSGLDQLTARNHYLIVAFRACSLSADHLGHALEQFGGFHCNQGELRPQAPHGLVELVDEVVVRFDHAMREFMEHQFDVLLPVVH